MASYSRLLLSGSTSGLPILVAATAIGSGTIIHTAVAGAAAFDEVYLWATNTDTVPRLLTIGFGGVTDPDNLLVKNYSIPGNSIPYLIASGQSLNGALAVKAAVDVANKINISGHVNRLQ